MDASNNCHSGTISQLNATVDGGPRYKGILTFARAAEFRGTVTFDGPSELDDAPTVFGVERHVGSNNVGDEAIPCTFGIIKFEGRWYAHSVCWPGTTALIIDPPYRAYPNSPATNPPGPGRPKKGANKMPRLAQ